MYKKSLIKMPRNVQKLFEWHNVLKLPSVKFRQMIHYMTCVWHNLSIKQYPCFSPLLPTIIFWRGRGINPLFLSFFFILPGRFSVFYPKLLPFAIEVNTSLDKIDVGVPYQGKLEIKVNLIWSRFTYICVSKQKKRKKNCIIKSVSV